MVVCIFMGFINFGCKLIFSPPFFAHGEILLLWLKCLYRVTFQMLLLEVQGSQWFRMCVLWYVEVLV